ncbi:MAG: helix-turn-helix domain containing protein [Parcubacteria group bacterium]|nr:helix-turn-helix domain containing protein [Parcubacteria group bacterium]
MNPVKSNKINQKNTKLRLSWFKYFKRSKNAAKTCRYFGISRQTYYKWLKRYIKHGRRGLINRSKKPKSIKLKANPKIKRLIKNWMKKGLKPSQIKNQLKKVKKLEISYSYLQKMSAKANKK